MKCKETNIQNISLRSFGRCQVFFSVCVVRVEIFELYGIKLLSICSCINSLKLISLIVIWTCL